MAEVETTQQPAKQIVSATAGAIAELQRLLESENDADGVRLAVKGGGCSGLSYVLEFSNVGGLVMPIILKIVYTDASTEELYLPAEIWRSNPLSLKKLIVRLKDIESVEVDPYWETADVDVSNNHYPRKIIPSRLEIFDPPESPQAIQRRDLMQDMKTELKTDAVKTDGPDSAPVFRSSGDEPVPLKVVD